MLLKELLAINAITEQTQRTEVCKQSVNISDQVHHRMQFSVGHHNILYLRLTKEKKIPQKAAVFSVMGKLYFLKTIL